MQRATFESLVICAVLDWTEVAYGHYCYEQNKHTVASYSSNSPQDCLCSNLRLAVTLQNSYIRFYAQIVPDDRGKADLSQKLVVGSISERS